MSEPEDQLNGNSGDHKSISYPFAGYAEFFASKVMCSNILEQI